jgi:protein-S-isoprenylcysteine O-methyltransferase Ste14
MILDQTEILVILTYISILGEIIVFPVPSMASSYNLILKMKPAPNDSLYTKVQNLNLWQKIISLALPTLLSVTAYCVPLILILISKFTDDLAYKTERLEFIVIAFILIITGRIISLYSVFKIRRNNRQVGNSFELKTQSIFSISRNPILFGMYVTFVGMIILFPRFYMLIAFAYYVVHMHFRILIEESFLKYRFGAKYTDYQEKTKRYL